MTHLMTKQARTAFDMIEDAIKSNDLGTVREACAIALEQLREDYSNPRTLGCMVGRVRVSIKAMTQTTATEYALKKFGLSRAEWFDINKLSHVAHAAKPIETPAMNSTQMIDKANQLAHIDRDWIQSSDNKTAAFRSAVGIALLTGRRSVEVMHLGHFEDAAPGMLLFHGQAKTRHGDPEPYQIFNLSSMNADELNAQMHAIRDRVGVTPEISNYEASRRTGTGLNVSARSEFDMTPHKLRSVYVATCWDKFGRGSGLQKPTFLMMLLGHENHEAGAYYQGIHVKKPVGRRSLAGAPIGKAWGDNIRQMAVIPLPPAPPLPPPKPKKRRKAAAYACA